MKESITKLQKENKELRQEVITLECMTKVFDKKTWELSQELLEKENIIHLLRRLVEDWLNQIPMTITFREKFYQIVGEPYPDWFEIPEPGLHHRQWVENNSLGETKNE